jgi:hypothetical protein
MAPTFVPGRQQPGVSVKPWRNARASPAPGAPAASRQNPAARTRLRHRTHRRPFSGGGPRSFQAFHPPLGSRHPAGGSRFFDSPSRGTRVARLTARGPAGSCASSTSYSGTTAHAEVAPETGSLPLGPAPWRYAVPWPRWRWPAGLLLRSGPCRPGSAPFHSNSTGDVEAFDFVEFTALVGASPRAETRSQMRASGGPFESAGRRPALGGRGNSAYGPKTPGVYRYPHVMPHQRLATTSTFGRTIARRRSSA